MSTPAARRPSLPARVLIAPIRFYQRFITPYTPATCRYYPTCSAYAVTALREHGALRGSWLALRRLGRCHPWSGGGIDHVPPRRERTGRRGSSSFGADATVLPRPTTSHLTGQMSGRPLGRTTPGQSPTARRDQESTAA